MRYLVFLLLFSVALVAESESALSVEPMVVFPSSVLVEQQTTESTAHLVVLGALEKVNHELQPEKFILVPGRKEASTWYLPEARRTKQVAEHFKSQLVGSANILFECRGRSCGSSSYWASILSAQYSTGPSNISITLSPNEPRLKPPFLPHLLLNHPLLNHPLLNHLL